MVCGTLTVSPPPPKHIQHSGITITLKLALQIYSEEGELPLREHTWTLLEPGIITEPISLPIEVDLAPLQLLPSYAAKRFEIR